MEHSSDLHSSQQDNHPSSTDSQPQPTPSSFDSNIPHLGQPSNYTEVLLHTLVQMQQQTQILMQQSQASLRESQSVSAQVAQAVDYNSQVIRHIGDTVDSGNRAPRRGGRVNGPKIKDPSQYDGDRTEGRLDDHIREVEDWYHFYNRRDVWESEEDAVKLAATFLSSSVRSLFEATASNVATMSQYTTWLNNCFRDSNEQTKYKDHWANMTQGSMSVMEFVTEIIKLGAKIRPTKTPSEMKEAFRIGISFDILGRMTEHTEWDDLPFGEYINRADRVEQSIQRSRGLRRIAENREERSNRFYSIRTPRGRTPSPKRGKEVEKGSAAWEEMCRANNSCFECGKPGHVASKCYKRTRNSTKDRAPTPARGRSASAHSRDRSRSQSRGTSRGRSQSRERAVSFKQGN